MPITRFQANEIVTRNNVNRRLDEIEEMLKSYTVNIPVNWSGSSAPYTQTVSLEGIKSTDSTIADISLSDTTSTALSELDAWGCISKITTNEGSITITCLERKPEISFNIQLKVVG